MKIWSTWPRVTRADAATCAQPSPSPSWRLCWRRPNSSVFKMRRQRICRTTFWPATPGSVAGEIQSPHRGWSFRNTHAFASSLGSTRSSGRTVMPSTLRPCNLDDCTGKSVPSSSSSLCTDRCSNPCRWTPCSCRLRAYTSSLVTYRLLYRAMLRYRHPIHRRRTVYLTS